MAKFNVSYSSTYAGFESWDDKTSLLSADDLLEVLRPAAIFLRDAYRKKLMSLGLYETGELADSIDIDDSAYTTTLEKIAFIFVGPTGKRKRGFRIRASRAGSPTAKYAKHNRRVNASRLRNDELGYLLEVGTPRIPATHWMENTNEENAEQVQQLLDDNFTELLKQKGLL